MTINNPLIVEECSSKEVVKPAAVIVACVDRHIIIAREATTLLRSRRVVDKTAKWWPVMVSVFSSVGVAKAPDGKTSEATNSSIELNVRLARWRFKCIINEIFRRQFRRLAAHADFDAPHGRGLTRQKSPISSHQASNLHHSAIPRRFHPPEARKAAGGATFCADGVTIICDIN